MKYGINLLLWTAGVTPDIFPRLVKLRHWGYDGVELPLFHEDDASIRATARELDNLGLERTAVCVCTPQTNPISGDKRIRQAALDHLKQRIDWAAAAGASTLVGPFHSALGELPGRGRTADEWKWCAAGLRQAAEYAEQQGVVLSVEPLNRFEAYFLNTAADAARLVREVDHPALGYLYDTFHANIEEGDPAASISDNAAEMNHFHVSENHRGEPGTGHVHWDASFSALKATGYDGWLMVEAFGRALPELAAATCIWRDLFSDGDELAQNALQFMKQKWEAA